ncbi:hypothetical protein HELRODRAFT_192412 [Helobdella robusta]|uniref:PX domain-containing protein n=1 Tax=Helobdella robusta TaxID=6412 RepID=T1FTX7_HELRO|nr:hypothetical protein HELRODRAFT_192412 [Helobdella robusta]ESO00773.1 hypothetical protein HELRODRAFT_192412 [Helobdella robusta]
MASTEPPPLLVEGESSSSVEEAIGIKEPGDPFFNVGLAVADTDSSFGKKDPSSGFFDDIDIFEEEAKFQRERIFNDKMSNDEGKKSENFFEKMTLPGPDEGTKDKNPTALAPPSGHAEPSSDGNIPPQKTSPQPPQTLENIHLESILDSSMQHSVTSLLSDVGAFSPLSSDSAMVSSSGTTASSNDNFFADNNSTHDEAASVAVATAATATTASASTSPSNASAKTAAEIFPPTSPPPAMPLGMQPAVATTATTTLQQQQQQPLTSPQPTQSSFLPLMDMTQSTLGSPSTTFPTILEAYDPQSLLQQPHILSPPSPSSMLPFQTSSSVSPPSSSAPPTSSSAPPPSSSSSSSSLPLFRPPAGYKQVDHPTANVNVNPPKFSQKEPQPDPYSIIIRIDEVKKVGDGVNAYMTFRICTKTDIPAFRHPTNEVFRRFSDFLGLHERLVEKHAREGRIIPQAPEKRMAKVKVSKNDSTTEFVENRRASLERYLCHIAANPHLRSDPIFVDFLETEGDLARATNTSALSGAGVKRLLLKVGEGFGKIAYRMEETDEWMAKRNEDLNSLEQEYRSLQSNLEHMIQSRREYSQNLGMLSRSMSLLASVEENVALSRVLAQSCEVFDGLESSHSIQVNDDMLNVLDYVKDHIGVIQSVKNALQERVKMHKIWKDSEVTLAKKREVKVKLELAHKMSDKIAEAEREVKEWEHNLEKSEEDFERISENVKQEMLRVDVENMGAFRTMALAYLESCLANQQRVIKLWEAFLIEARSL